MSLATLNGTPIYEGRITWPYAGIWHADLKLTEAIDTSGPQVLLFAGLPWACAVVRAIDFSGSRGVRVVGGTGGWRTTIPAKQYGQGLVTTLHVMTDAALACREVPPVLGPLVPLTVGSGYCRPNDAASYVLQEFLGDAWWLDSTGTVQTIPRPPTPVASPFSALAVRGSEGKYEIGTESPNDWLPGATFLGPTVSGTINRTMHTLTRDTLRTEVLTGPGGADRFRASQEAILSGFLTSQAAYARWEYRVAGVTPGPPVTVSGVPVDPVRCPFGPLANITLWPGPDGGYAVPAAGSLVLVEFHDGNVAKPAVCGLDPSVPAALTTLGGGVVPLARVGDTITITPTEFAQGAPTSVSGGAVSTSAPFQGTITSGSAKVLTA